MLKRENIVHFLSAELIENSVFILFSVGDENRGNWKLAYAFRLREYRWQSEEKKTLFQIYM